MIRKDKIYAVIGASSDPEKYGHKVLLNLHRSGYEVYAVNPKGGEISGLKVYPGIESLPQVPDVAILVVPPAVSEKLLPSIKEAGISLVWFQPGSESRRALDYCEKNDMRYISDACVMVERKR